MVMEKSKRARASDAGGKEAKKAAGANGQAAATMAEEKLAEFVEKMRKLHEEIEEVTDKATEEVLEVERSFVSQRRRPLYDKRKAVLDKIPHFWQNVLCNCGAIRHSTVEQDVKVLKHLTSLDVEECKEEGDIGYTITMTFSPNPFFSNETLTRALVMQDELTLRVTGTRINWKEGQDYTAGIKAYVDDEEEEEEGKEGEEGKEQLVSLFSWIAFGDDDPISVANDDVSGEQGEGRGVRMG
ncbi:unnamed protein product [Closterium sp. NIES-65]|nr:unnamed protein product [Closterium sp. NIES-65]